MKSLSNADKAKIAARINSCDFSPFQQKLASNITKTYGSLVGRDIKVWAQVAVYVLMDIVPDDELEVWIHLSNVSCLSTELLFTLSTLKIKQHTKSISVNLYQGTEIF